MRILFLIAALMVTPVLAEDLTEEEIEVYERLSGINATLWNECKPMSMSVTFDGSDKVKERIENAVRSRLRAARIYDETDSSLRSENLSTNINQMALGKGSTRAKVFFISLQINQPAIPFWAIDKIPFTVPFGTVYKAALWPYVTTWETEILGYGYDFGDNVTTRILSAVSEATDKFIDEYLEANAKACKK